MVKKIIRLFSILLIPLTSTSCLTKEVQVFDNIYGMDIYDVMELDDTVILELEITGLSKSVIGYEFTALDKNGISTTDKSEEILGSPINQIFYSLPNGFGSELVVGDTYYITFTKKLNIPNTFPQFGLLGDVPDLSDDNFNYDGYYCNVNDISNCYKMPATEYEYNEDLYDYSEIVDEATDIAKVLNTEGTITSKTIADDGNVDSEGNPYKANFIIKNNDEYLKLKKNIRNNQNHNQLVEELIIGDKYIIKFVIRSGITSGTGTEIDPYVIDADVARTMERLQ